jgi:hypothetical protein
MQQQKLVNQAEYARLSKLNRSTVSRQVRSKLIPVTASGLIDMAAADRARATRLDPARQFAAQVRDRWSKPARMPPGR